jgi:DNA-binding PucR family transcriptional regulator
VEELLGRVANRFEAGLAPLADQIVARMREEIPEFDSADSPELWDTARRVTMQSRGSQARHVRQGRAEPEVLNEADAEAVHVSVHAGYSVGSVLHAFRIGHDVSIEAWLEAVDQVSDSEEDRSACTRAVVRSAIAYDDRLARLLEQEYDAERNRVLGSSDQARLRLMRDLVDGVTDRAPALEYDLSLEHIGLVAWGDSADTVLQSLARTLDARLVSAPTPAGFRWAWLGSRSFAPGALEALTRSTPKNGISLAIGQPGAGIEGFRRTHRQAGAAHVVATRKPRPLTLYQDVAVEALALRDESAAREFVSGILTGIGGEDRRSQQLRATLRAYFQSEQNASATAAALGVHDATIARHLTEVEDRIGGRVNNRRVELELALRLNSLLRATDSASIIPSKAI